MDPAVRDFLSPIGSSPHCGGVDLPTVTITSAALLGVEAVPITLEATLRAADAEKPMILGRVDSGVREAYSRVLGAFRALDLPAPRGAATLNFAPAAVPKRGSGFDLPMALALAAAAGQFPGTHLEGIAAFGEVALGGRILPERGAVAIGTAVRRRGCTVLMCAREDANVAALVPGLTVFGVRDLREAIEFLAGLLRLDPQPIPPPHVDLQRCPDLADIRGHLTPKRALAVAAAGGHNLLFVGPPGSGKSALVRRMVGLLPPPEREDALEILRIHTSADRGADASLYAERFGARPFRAPHHTSSTASLVGGGADPRPGECTLAHRGVLFLDELPEFRREALEALRQPLEDGHITVGRASTVVTMPAQFQLVAAMNPCPCGFAGHPHRPCECPPARVHAYRARISGPLLDRVDLQVEVPALDAGLLRQPRDEANATSVWQERIQEAHARQLRRNQTVHGPCPNGRLQDEDLTQAVAPTEDVLDAVDRLLRRHHLSGRARVRLLRIARTLADLDQRDAVEPADVMEAARLRGWELVR